MSRDDRLPEGQKLYRPDFTTASSARLFVPLDAATLERLAGAARARGVPVGQLAAEMLAEALRSG